VRASIAAGRRWGKNSGLGGNDWLGGPKALQGAIGFWGVIGIVWILFSTFAPVKEGAVVETDTKNPKHPS
jgi:hypothetical protein